MGHGGQLICFSCGYAIDVLLGVGMMQCGAFEVPTENNTEAFNHRLRKCIPNKSEFNLVRGLLLRKHGIATAYGYGLYRCSKCGRFKNLFHYRIKHDEGIYEPEHECKKCAVKLDYLVAEAETEEGETHIDVSQFSCPKCGKLGLSLGGGIMWD